MTIPSTIEQYIKRQTDERLRDWMLEGDPVHIMVLLDDAVYKLAEEQADVVKLQRDLEAAQERISELEVHIKSENDKLMSSGILMKAHMTPVDNAIYWHSVNRKRITELEAENARLKAHIERVEKARNWWKNKSLYSVDPNDNPASETVTHAELVAEKEWLIEQLTQIKVGTNNDYGIGTTAEIEKRAIIAGLKSLHDADVNEAENAVEYEVKGYDGGVTWTVEKDNREIKFFGADYHSALAFAELLNSEFASAKEIVSDFQSLLDDCTERTTKLEAENDRFKAALEKIDDELTREILPPPIETIYNIRRLIPIGINDDDLHNPARETEQGSE